MPKTATAEATEQKKPEIFLHTVEVEISTEEAAERTRRLLDVLNEIDTIEADKASRNSDFNTELKQKRKEAHKVRDAINLGKERRDVECYEQPDERRNIVFIVRASDHKVLDERAMTLEDRMHLGQTKTEAEKEAEAAASPAEKATEGSGGGADDANGKAGKAGKAGKGGGATVTRIKASDVKKRKAEREAKDAADKAKKLADEQAAKNAAADDDDSDADSDEDDDE